MRQVIAQLERLQRRSMLLFFVQRAAVVLAWVVAALAAIIAFDYALRLPSAFRLVLLIAALAALGMGVWGYLRPALRFRPSVTQIALRIERLVPALAGRLASGVEFAAAGIDLTNPLAARSTRDAEARMQGVSLGRAVRPGRTMLDLSVLLVLLVGAGVFWLVNPDAAATGLKRAILPWSDAAWPSRTGVESRMSEVLTETGVFPRGQALPLRAAATRGRVDQRLEAHYRMKVDGRFGTWQHVVLTPQHGAEARRHESTEARRHEGTEARRAESRRGEGVQERLVDSTAEEIEVYFTSWDDRTEVESIVLVEPPAVREARLSVTPPEYVVSGAEARRHEGTEARRADGPQPGQSAWAYAQSLGPGVDSRSATERPSLVGSNVELAIELNKPLPLPETSGAIEGWLRSTLGWSDELGALPRFRVDAGLSPHSGGQAAEAGLSPHMGGSVWTLSWRLAGTTRLSLELVDEHGLRNVEPISFRIDAVEDRMPSVAIVQPASDEHVLKSAVVELIAEAQDDVAVARVAMEGRVQKSGEREPNESPAWSAAIDAGAPTARLREALNLATLDVAEGDVVHVVAIAKDNFDLNGEPATAGRRHEPVTSNVRRLRIISDIEFASHLRRQLSGVRQNAIRLEAQQSELQDSIIDDSVQPGAEQAQGRIAERIAQQQDAIDEIQRQMQRNRLDDHQLESLLGQSRDLLDFAGRAASQAAAQIAARREEGPAEALDDEADDERRAMREPHEQDRDVVEAQQEVREELTDLIELLDRDEDTWVITRQLESVLEEQRRLQQETARAARETIGLSLDELPEVMLSELDRIAMQQQELRDQARELMEALRQRAESMEDVEPQAAAGMRTAARTGEQREVDRDMDNAAERVRQNQLRTAGQSQQGAAETLERMLQDIQETNRARAEQLMRQLASLIDSIERLITVQENEIIALERTIEADDFARHGGQAGRDRAMIRLNQNTQAVAGEARQAGQEARRIARTLDRAADAQGAAVVALRSEPVNVEGAMEAEGRSLELLREAKELAEQLQQQTQEEELRRRREELIEAYRELVEMQIAVHDRAAELAEVAGDELDRRQLVEARRLSTQQEQVRTELDELRQRTQEVTDSPVFNHVHNRIDEWSQRVRDDLSDGRVDAGVTDRQQRIIRSIGRLIEALADSIRPPDDFESNQGQGGGGSGGRSDQPLIPPVTELRLLRGIQEEVYDRTKGLDQRRDLGDAERRERLRDLAREQRDLQRLGEEMLERLQQQ